MSIMNIIFKNRNIPIALLLIIPAITLLILFILPMTVRIVNEGNVLGAIFCIGVILLWILYPLINRVKLLRIVLRITVGFVIAGLAWCLFLSVNMIAVTNKQPPTDGGNDYTVIVLGCHVWHGVPSTMLTSRLRTARDYMNENESVACVTTGGYGVGQPYSEAETSRNWLVRNEIDESRIYLEDRSTSTLENLLYANSIIIHEELSKDIVIVSDGFHLWRATLMAEDLLFSDVYVIPAQTRPPHLIPTYWVREWLALSYYFVDKLSPDTTLVNLST